MPLLDPGATLRSEEGRLLVENRLAVGRHLFRLSVVDDAGNESAPAELAVVVREAGRGRTPRRPVVRPARRPRRPTS